MLLWEIKETLHWATRPTSRASLQLRSKRDQQWVLNKQAFNKLCAKNTVVYKLLVEASLANIVVKSNQDCFVMKTLFKIAHFMIIKYRGYKHNFQDVVKLVKDCQGNEVKTHLISTPKNTIENSPKYVRKFIHVIYDYIKVSSTSSVIKRKTFHFFQWWGTKYHIYGTDCCLCYIWA